MIFIQNQAFENFRHVQTFSLYADSGAEVGRVENEITSWVKNPGGGLLKPLWWWRLLALYRRHVMPLYHYLCTPRRTFSPYNVA